MIHSMTAFARGERRSVSGRLALEIRSVNHRFLEPGLRLPESLRHCEAILREQVRDRLDRGKVDVTLRLDPGPPSTAKLSPPADSLDVDRQALAAVVAAAGIAGDALGAAAGPVDPLELLRWPGVLREAQPDQDALMADVAALATDVLDALIEHRAREGARLSALIETRLAAIAAIVEEVRIHADTLVGALRERLHRRARALLAELDPQRLEQEVALLAQKADIAEELDRLDAHVAEVRKTLADAGPAGRRLDFLAQELGREANTLAAKASLAEVALRAVDLKVLIEQIREQIQNVE